MSTQPTRSILVIASAIIIAGVLIAASLFYAISAPEKTSTVTISGQSTTTTSTTTSTITSSSIPAPVTTTTTMISEQNQTDQTVTRTTTFTLTTTSVSQNNYTITQTVTSTQTENTPPPWYGLVYLSSLPGCTVTIENGTTYPEPCFGYTDPILFNCAAAAATAQGCVQKVNITGTNGSFTLKVWYPYNSGTPAINCQWEVTSIPGPIGPSNAYCISANSTSFLVSTQAPGHV